MKKTSPVKVSIKNFQSIKELDIEIDGFTCIIGKNCIGKSAIIRAISGAILNDPVKEYIRHGESAVSVKIESENYSFHWEKGDKINRYTIGDQVYDKTGQKQLKEINDMGFSSIRVGDEELQPWLGDQWNRLFLLDKSGPQVTEFITGVTRLHILQNAIAHANKDKRSLTDANKSLELRNRELKSTIEKTDRVSLMEKVISDMKSQKESIEEYESKIERMKNYNSNIKLLNKKISSVDKIEDVVIPSYSIEPVVKRLERMSFFFSNMESSALKIISTRKITEVNVPDIENEISSSIDNLKKMITYKKRIKEFSKKEYDIPNINDTPRDYEKDIEVIGKMKKFQKSIKEAETAAKTEEKNLEKIKSDILAIEQELKKYPSCPYCGGITEQEDHQPHQICPEEQVSAS